MAERGARTRELATLDALAEQRVAQLLRAAGRWLGVGIAAGPALELADRHGLLTAIADPAMLMTVATPGLLLGLAGFVGLGVAAARLLPRHSPRGRRRFFAACAIPIAVWILSTVVSAGIRAPLLVPVLALGFAWAQLRAVPR